MPELYRKLDAVIALGGNMALFRRQNELKEYNFLSVESRITTRAACLLYEYGYAKEIIFSTGHTSGVNNPSEACGMAKYAVAKFGLPKKVITLEQKSIDTGGNAVECIQIIKRGRYKDVALLSIWPHITNAASYFQNHGLTISPTRVWASERVVYHHLYQKSPERANQFIKDFEDHLFFSGIGLREFVRSILIDTIDPNGDLLHQITKRTRR